MTQAPDNARQNRPRPADRGSAGAAVDPLELLVALHHLVAREGGRIVWPQGAPSSPPGGPKSRRAATSRVSDRQIFVARKKIEDAPASLASRGLDVTGAGALRIGYADPPYVACAHLYREHPDYGGEVDHAVLIERLQRDFDGWILHAAATPRSMSVLAPLVERVGARWMAWVKGFAAFKRNVSVAYAWEPVIVKAARKPVVSKRLVMRDWIECPMTLKRGLTGAKPEAVCHWAFEMVGARPDDAFADLFPGTGGVLRAWTSWQGKFLLPTNGPTSP